METHGEHNTTHVRPDNSAHAALASFSYTMYRIYPYLLIIIPINAAMLSAPAMRAPSHPIAKNHRY